MPSLPIPQPAGEPLSTQKIKSSWTKNLDAANYVAPAGLLFFDTYAGVLRLGDGETPGGRLVGGGGGGNGTPSAPNQSIQFNDNGVFGGNVTLTFDAANSILSLTGNQNVVGNISVVGNIIATEIVQANSVRDDDGIFLNANVITMSYTLPPGYNGITGGPITIENSAVVTVPDGQRWTIV
jgi:hypothetical protein